MLNINNYISEKLHLNKDYKMETPIGPGEYAYAVFATGDIGAGDSNWIPTRRTGEYTTVEEYEQFLLKGFKNVNIRYLKVFLNKKKAQEYEANELPKLMNNEK